MAGWVRRFWHEVSGLWRGEPPPALPDDPEHPTFTFTYARVVQVELKEIMRRRRLRDPADLPAASDDNVDLLGLALSGGGIRSAAVCLGVVQALDSLRQLTLSPLGKPREDPLLLANAPRGADEVSLSVFDRFDYLSTVSGGGYLGCSLAAAMTAGQTGAEPLPFPFRSTFETAEPPAVRHLRDHSNYLFSSPGAVVASIAIYLRGLAVNLFLTLPPLLGAAALVVLYARLAGSNLLVWLAALLVLALILWGIQRSLRGSPNEIGGRLLGVFSVALMGGGAIAVVAFSAWVAELAAHSRSAGWDLAVFTTALAPFATLFAFLAPRMVALVEKLAGRPGVSALLARFTGIAVLWLGAAILPLLLWLAVVLLAAWALPPVCPVWNCASIHPPGWWAAAYIGAGLVIFGIGQLFKDNANSLHRLYRDRLSAAFLVRVDGDTVASIDRFQLTDRPKPGETSATMAASPIGLAEDASPYLLINTAVNIQASREINKRGRNADFFLFSRNYVGSAATGYRRTEAMMAEDPALDLGTAMAASGAAFSSNMGANSLAPLTPTLALLNARLGYWLPNPMGAAKREDIARLRDELTVWSRLLRRTYFISEAFGLLDETGPKVYITDGGHIDNLGLFELLRRRCRLIVVVDAESDADYRFSSLVALQKHARIDLGVRIDLPWEAIARASKSCDAGGAATPGPHAAIGRVMYPGRPTSQNPAARQASEGILVYLKSSLTGDENDLIRAYKARNPSFPHQTTIDQLFSEEQFEVYRALGFHMANRLFSGKDRLFVASAGEGEGHEKAGREVESIAADDPLLAEVVKLLHLPVVRRRF
ncbi:patatin-like phospholipase family protein [Ancylobacter sp. A5.8]|uniref:patatin-like phospholipase family protein n=1 Tax=Ancylobacter gelatini TaxID=2919920 RepID=UPI001F4EED72|nr:patatin-like phospholipase family protein [Ancylobacter gelatini]MCJ8144956.1 patatin-like phospholipase family protein [Ancylobacter gelatini]